MAAVQAAGPEPMGDRGPSDPGTRELRDGDQAVLAGRNGGNEGVRSGGCVICV